MINGTEKYIISVCQCQQLHLPIVEVLSVVWDWVGDFGTGFGSDLGTSSDTLTLSEVTLDSCLSSPSAVSISFCTSSLACR